MDVTAENLYFVYEERKRIQSVRMVFEPKLRGFFQARFTIA